MRLSSYAKHRKDFFFEKKKQKTFYDLKRAVLVIKVFWFFFSKKNALSFLARATPAGLAWLLAAAGPDRTSAVFGDWETRCATPAHVCELIQGVLDKEHRPILTLAVKPAAGDPVLLVQMPVNVLIGGEMALAFDKDQPPVPVKLQVCVASGCFASLELTPSLRERLAAWGDKPASFTFVAASQAHVTVPVSWRGFGEAFAAMRRPG